MFYRVHYVLIIYLTVVMQLQSFKLGILNVLTPSPAPYCVPIAVNRPAYVVRDIAEPSHSKYLIGIEPPSTYVRIVPVGGVVVELYSKIGVEGGKVEFVAHGVGLQGSNV
jgi:hypothetical protein